MSWMAFGEPGVCADAGAAASAAMARCAEASQEIRRGSGMMTIRFNRLLIDAGATSVAIMPPSGARRKSHGRIAVESERLRAGTLWLLVEYNAPGRRNHRPHRVGGIVETDEVI